MRVQNSGPLPTHQGPRDLLTPGRHLPDGVSVQKLDGRLDQLVLAPLGRVVQGRVAQGGLREEVGEGRGRPSAPAGLGRKPGAGQQGGEPWSGGDCAPVCRGSCGMLAAARWASPRSRDSLIYRTREVTAGEILHPLVHPQMKDCSLCLSLSL